eukprot:Pgem_evm1s3669
MAWYNNQLGNNEIERAIHILNNTTPANNNIGDLSQNAISYTGYAFGINRYPPAMARVSKNCIAILSQCMHATGYLERHEQYFVCFQLWHEFEPVTRVTFRHFRVISCTCMDWIARGPLGLKLKIMCKHMISLCLFINSSYNNYQVLMEDNLSTVGRRNAEDGNIT